MKRLLVLIITAVAFTYIAADWSAARNLRQESRPLVSVSGLVTQVDTAGSFATVKNDQAVVVRINVSANTIFLRVSAGAQSLEQASSITFSDVSVGDRVLAKGPRSDDAAQLHALRVIVLSKSEISKKRQQDLEQWQKRGIQGLVKAVNPANGQIGLELRGAGSLINVNATKADFRRYTAASTRFEDAASSTISALGVGDQVRALGQRSTDGKSFDAEVIVSGAFKTIGATVTSVDVQTGELKATTLDQRKPISVTTVEASAIHRIPASLVPAIVQQSRQPRPPTQNPGQPQTANNVSSPSTPPPDIQQSIDSLPRLKLPDIKVGDVVAITAAKQQDESRMVAIKLIAGVDAVLRALAPPPGRPQVVRLSAGLPAAFDFSVIPNP